jgi:hypothetical protein
VHKISEKNSFFLVVEKTYSAVGCLKLVDLSYCLMQMKEFSNALHISSHCGSILLTKNMHKEIFGYVAFNVHHIQAMLN